MNGSIFTRGYRAIRRQGVWTFLKQLFPWFRNRLRYISVPMMNSPTLPPDQFAQIKHSQDYFRFAAFGLAIQRILRENIAGDLAEAGVWRGDSARFIHMFAPDRVLYLFDTFEGFENRGPHFGDTSVEVVLKTIGDSRNITIRKGLFPGTSIGLEHHQFAFVHLDMNDYEAMLEGWKFFYPRLSKGGYIFVHNYNFEVDHVLRASNEFLTDKCERIIELPDTGGSAMIRKL